MKFLYEYQLRITTLTPVHIGCGEDYTPTDYVMDEDTLYAFDSQAVADTLPENAREQLQGILEGTVGEDALIEIRKLFYKQRESLMAKATHYVQVSPGVRYLYEERIGQVAQREERVHNQGRNVINKLEIERTFYNPVNQRPIIPGSSLKGAIRTALLDSINAGKQVHSDESNQKLQKRLFEYQEIQDDPMRLVRLADTNEMRGHTTISEIRFAVNRPRREPSQSKTNRTKDEGQGLYQSLETIPALNLRAYESRLTIQDLSQLKSTKGLSWTIQQITEACNLFYQKLLQNELKILEKMNYVRSDWVRGMEKLIDNPLLKSNKAMLLRVGRHSGAEAVTLNGVRKIKIMGRHNNFESQPRTLWLASDERKASSNMMPFGWLLIEIDPPVEPTSALEEFKELTKQSCKEKLDWMERQRRRLQEVQDDLHQRDQQKKKQEQARLAKEQEEREHQAYLASMPEEQRAIAELKTLIEQERANDALNPQGRVPGRLSELLKQASDWPQEVRLNLCDLAETIYRELGMLKGKRGRERKADIENLRNLKK